MIVIREEHTLFADMEPHTVFGYSGTYCVKLVHPVEVRDNDGVIREYHAFDLHQSRLAAIPQNARGFIVKGAFVEGAKAR